MTKKNPHLPAMFDTTTTTAHKKHPANHHKRKRKSSKTLALWSLMCATMCIALFVPYLSTRGSVSAGRDAASLMAANRLRAESQEHLTTTNTNDNSEEAPELHIVFSSSCSDQQNWEGYVFFYHCRRVRQPGTVTRIVSGCKDQEQESLQKFHDEYIAPMAQAELQRFEVHFTPDYSRVRLESGKHPYKYMNKPYGLRHWMEQGKFFQLGWKEEPNHSNITVHFPKDDNTVLDGVVILMDPDMILLQPITHDYSRHTELWVDGKRPPVTKVQHGHPIAQQDGYLTNEWMKLDFMYITNNSAIQPPPWNEGPLHWNTGPPYLATVYDMYRIVSLWTEVAPRVLDVHPHLFAEMYGFIISTVMLDLPFSLTKSIVVSTTSTKDREGWPFVDALPDSEICHVPQLATSYHADDLPVLPIGLHYCKRYVLGKWFFSKYRLKKNIMNCEKNLIRPPPSDIYPKLDHAIFPPRADLKDAETYKEQPKKINAKTAKREAFMLCGMISAVNEALRFYKHQACGDSANYNETYTIHEDPTNH